MCCISMEKAKEKEEREILINLKLYSVHDFCFISPQIATPGPSKGLLAIGNEKTRLIRIFSPADQSPSLRSGIIVNVYGGSHFHRVELRRHDHEMHHRHCDSCSYSSLDGRQHRTRPAASATQRVSSSRQPLVRRPGRRPCLFRTEWPTRRIPNLTYSLCAVL